MLGYMNWWTNGQNYIVIAKSMKQLALVLVLAVFSGSAAAGWERVGGKNERRGFYAYVDRATIEKSGSMAKMWVLVNYKTAQSDPPELKPFLSSKGQVEYDCKDKRIRTLAYSFYSGRSAGGTVVYSNSEPDEWQPISSDSTGETLWKVACGK